MKIGVLTSVHSPFDVRIFHKECRALAEAGHNVTVIAPYHADQVVDGIRIKAVGANRTGRAARLTRTMWEVAGEAIGLDAHVYHLHDPELIPLGLLLRGRGKQVIYDAHEDLPQTIGSKEYLPRAARGPVARLSGSLEHLAARYLSAIVAATPTIAERFTATNPRTILVRNFVSLQEWQPVAQLPWSERPPIVAYVGLITWDRGLREMVQAVDCLPEASGARLALAGPRSDGLWSEAGTSLAGWHRVDDLGVLDRTAVAALLGRVRAGLVILHPAPNYRVSLPIKLFEYMAAGLPVVVSDFPLLRRIVNEAQCGIVVDPLDVRAIADAVQFLLHHPEEAEAMGRQGREAAVHTYNWESEAGKLLQLYRDLEVAPSSAP